MRIRPALLSLLGGLASSQFFASSSNQAILQTYTILDGQKIQVQTANGFPLPVEDTYTKVLAAGLVLAPSKEDPKQSGVSWIFSIQSKSGAKPVQVLVEDVTGATAQLLVRDDAPNLNANKRWGHLTNSREIASRETTPWLFESGSSTKVFRFIVNYPSGSRSVLVQPSIVSDLAKAAILRKLDSPVASSSGPFKTSASPKLIQDIVSNVMLFHGAKFPGCTEAKPTSAIVISATGSQDNSKIIEDWTVTGCNKTYIYKVQLVSSPKGGTDILIEIGPDNPRIIPA